MERPVSTCPRCNEPQTAIDRFGERLVGCIECNRWTWPTSESVSMQLPEEDLETLRKHVNRGR